MAHSDNSSWGILVAIVLFFLFVWFLQLIWNSAFVPVVTILCEINYWQTLLLVISLWIASWLVLAPFAGMAYGGVKGTGVDKYMRRFVDMDM